MSSCQSIGFPSVWSARIDTTFVIIVTGSLLAAIFNAAFSAGGALIVLAVTTTVLPVPAIVPIHSTLLIGSTLSRVVVFRRTVEWRLVRPFFAGSAVGALIGARVYVALPESIIATAIGMLMLVALWLPQIRWRPRIRHPWVVVGFLHTLISTLFAYGALLHSIVLHTGLDRRRIVGTMAGCLAGMGLFKIAGYAAYGFDYRPYFGVIAASLVVSLIGTAVGKRLGDRLREEQFRLIFRVLITVTALRLLYAALL